MPPPTQARIVIVGGGIGGCSTACPLSRMGQTDARLLEPGELTCSTPWHAAGLIGQMRPHRNMTQLSQHGIALCARLETETETETEAEAEAETGLGRVDALRTEPGRRALGAEAVLIDGQPVGELPSVGWSAKAGACVGVGVSVGVGGNVNGTGAPQPRGARL